MEALIHICQYDFVDFFNFTNKFTNESIFNVIEDIAPSFEDTMFDCQWQYESNECSEFFAPILTGEGFCFAFNSLNSHEIYTEQWGALYNFWNTIIDRYFLNSAWLQKWRLSKVIQIFHRGIWTRDTNRAQKKEVIRFGYSMRGKTIWIWWTGELHH